MAGLLTDEEMIDRMYGPNADTPTSEIYRLLGLNPNLRRGTILPIARNEQGGLEAAVPQSLIDLARAFRLPARAMGGGSYGPEDIANFALNTGALGAVGTKPAGALASGVAREKPTAPQSITSQATSVNQIPGLMRVAPLERGSRNLDYGGGKYDRGTDYLRNERGVESFVYDPFNRSPSHNASVVAQFGKNPADTATFANVLNVIPEKEHRLFAIKNAADLVKPGGKLFFSVYEKNKTGIGEQTRAGWQANLPLEHYLDEIRSILPDATREGNMIIATKPFNVSKIAK